jgi:hypothetical protein
MALPVGILLMSSSYAGIARAQTCFVTPEASGDGEANCSDPNNGLFIAPGTDGATIAGGRTNSVSSSLGTIGGGARNGIGTSAASSTICGGASNLIQVPFANAPGPAFSTIGGGAGNEVASPECVISGGDRNQIATGADGAAICGGRGNLIEGPSPRASEGENAFDAIVAGGRDNTIESFGGFSVEGSAILGGRHNLIRGATFAAIAGGDHNMIMFPQGVNMFSHAPMSFIGGGTQNLITHERGFIGGGMMNLAQNTDALVCGGNSNIADGNASAVLGGSTNSASADFSAVGGGQNNNAFANANNSFIAGGSNNTTGAMGGFGTNSFAAGSMAHADGDNCFVWSDGSAPGSPQMCTNTCGDGPTAHPTPGVCTTPSQMSGTSVQQFVVRSENGVQFITDGTDNGSGVPTAGVYLGHHGNQWNYFSDRNAKRDFAPVDTHDVLLRVVAMPITTWQYKSEDHVRHMGPMAQDFYAAFGLGEDERHIASLDEPAVALAAIQGLYREVLDRDETIQALTVKTRALEQANAEANRRVASLEKRLEAIEAQLRR